MFITVKLYCCLFVCVMIQLHFLRLKIYSFLFFCVISIIHSLNIFLIRFFYATNTTSVINNVLAPCR